MIKDFIASKIFRNLLIGLAVVAVLLLDFRLGEMVGSRKASFTEGWAESYHRNFAGPPEGFMPFRPMRHGDEFMAPHGLFASVISATGSAVIARDQAGMERTILLDGRAVIECNRDRISQADLRPGDRIVVIGDPDDQGRIVARLIRVFR